MANKINPWIIVAIVILVVIGLFVVLRLRSSNQLSPTEEMKCDDPTALGKKVYSANCEGNPPKYRPPQCCLMAKRACDTICEKMGGEDKENKKAECRKEVESQPLCGKSPKNLTGNQIGNKTNESSSNFVFNNKNVVPVFFQSSDYHLNSLLMISAIITKEKIIDASVIDDLMS